MIHLLVHDKKDTVGVAVIEGIKSGQEMIGWVMEDDSTIKVKAINDIPIGHKAALREIKKGDTIIKYGFDIGKAVADIKVSTETLLRLILEAGAYELVHRADIPPRVTMSEYVAIAYAFFTGKEPGLANGVLDRLARTLRGADL